MSLKTIIGLEIHVELQTDTKMFCGCKNEYGCPPNTNVCPICLGHPGTLPRINKRAIEYAIMAGNAFNCEISMDMKMDRKKYFYPDLVKGYQITQERTPICKNGYIEIDTENGVKKLRLQRIHIEEDTGKSIHNENGHTLMDYKMEEGSLRCDVNLNVVDEESGFKTKITEIKNLNSFKAALRAMEYEQKRHIENVKNNIVGEKETRRWDESKLETIIMRHKEEGNDYRFSVESDIPYIKLEKDFVEAIKEKMPELPKNKKNRFLAEYKLSEYDANVLTQNKYLSESFASLLKLVKENKINANVGKKLLRELFEKGDFDPLKVVEERGLIQISDDSALIEIVEEVLKNNPSSIEDYKNGKDRALGFLMGQCMKASKGKGNPQKFNELILERLV